ncbi:Double-strand-specific pac1 ribonuclease [Pseudocercospora fuligena]|uniref:Double-strand-specific pac1 ribonuclease n=1 Tax=Pseudocercospora fuligena TaxID=685502 RepID=A0A8H6RPQ0_9PEZI|nr:Double-strand-specific pac1 ribonuclease [Pseudocercospora fuligena]
MSKRTYENGGGPPTKRPREDYSYSRRDHYDDRRGRSDRYDDRHDSRRDDRREPSSYSVKCPHNSSREKQEPPPHDPYLPKPLPSRPELPAEWADAPFRHKSTAHDPSQMTYDRLEFIGDANIEKFATDLIFEKYPQLQVGEMSQLREQLVKNETLAGYSRAYVLEKKIKANDKKSMQKDSQGRGNKGWTKVIADVFEAYIAAIILSNSNKRTGEDIAEAWLRELWTPRIEALMQSNRVHASRMQSSPAPTSSSSPAKDAGTTPYDEKAKAILQQRVYRSAQQVKLDYVDAHMVELKGEKLGQNEWTRELYVVAPKYGYEREYLATGKGRNKVEADNWAAGAAMLNKKELVDDLERRVKADAEEHRRKRQEEAAMKSEASSDTF